MPMTVGSERSIELADETATLALGKSLAGVVEPGLLVFLHGPLGAGKTTLVRGLLRALGHKGPVRSPTYTLVETYGVDRLDVHHFDLYRLTDAEELEFMGLRDFLNVHAMCLIEWPERGAGILPRADIEIELNVHGTGRGVRLLARNERAEKALSRLNLK